MRHASINGCTSSQHLYLPSRTFTSWCCQTAWSHKMPSPPAFGGVPSNVKVGNEGRKSCAPNIWPSLL